MVQERESVVSKSAKVWRKRLAEHPISDILFPIGYRDPFNTMTRVSVHMESGGSVVAVTTHPSIEDIMRMGRFFVKWEAIRTRHMGGPAAVHQKFFVDLATGIFDMDKAYIPTQHTRDRRPVTDGEEMRALVNYRKLIVKLLQHNSLLAIESQADQMSRLEPPTKPVVDFVMSAIKSQHIPQVLVVPIGIEIEGIHGNYENVRNISFARHPYVFNVGQAYTAEEVMELSAKENISTDEFMYIRHRSLVAPEYLSKQSDLP